MVVSAYVVTYLFGDTHVSSPRDTSTRDTLMIHTDTLLTRITYLSSETVSHGLYTGPRTSPTLTCGAVQPGEDTVLQMYC